MDKLYVIVDIDGTVANCSHRLPFIHPEAGCKKNWGRFFGEMDKDTLFPHIKEIVNALSSSGHIIVFLTGRPETYYQKTVDWITKNDIKYDFLLMRVKGDHSSDVIAKKTLLDNFLKTQGDKTYQDILCAFEDRDRIIDLWKSLGIPVLEHKPYEESGY
jgi:hypothetical protein